MVPAAVIKDGTADRKPVTSCKRMDMPLCSIPGRFMAMAFITWVIRLPVDAIIPGIPL